MHPYFHEKKGSGFSSDSDHLVKNMERGQKSTAFIALLQFGLFGFSLTALVPYQLMSMMLKMINPIPIRLSV